MRYHKLFKTEMMTLFSKDYANLSILELRNFQITFLNAHFLQDFIPNELTLSHVNGTTLGVLIANLNDHACGAIKSLDISGVNIFKFPPFFPEVGELGWLSNLSTLNISDTSLDSSALAIVVEKCPTLKHLDISDNPVEDISCLLNLKDQLEGLVLHFNVMPEEAIYWEAIWTVLRLEKLQKLDLSAFEKNGNYRLSNVETLLSSGTFPHLKHFDISGNPLGLTSAELQTFIANHRNLRFLGLAHWPERLKAYDLSLKYPNITMSGDVGESMLIEAIRQYWRNRRSFDATLHNIYIQAESGHKFSADILDAILDAAEEIRITEPCTILYMATMYVVLNNLNPDELSKNLLTRLMKFNLDAMFQNRESYLFMNILMNKFKAVSYF
ncbi:unnamed protein product [Rodentolepis nana]|uniref:Protein zer-1-like protein n=1 Tax=Rodentolepis nana TaxID=102285 RepID=A0A0R3TD75_RODNA|nr:unnamed protein product [Rodentolepis nana]